MIKIVKVTYGLKGKGNEYSYVVSGDPRKGQIVQPSVRHYISGKIYGTTGIIQGTQNLETKGGQETLQKVESQTYTKGKNDKGSFAGEPVQAKSIATNVRSRNVRGQYRGHGLGKTTLNEDTNRYQVEGDKPFEANAYIKNVRNASVQQRDNFHNPPPQEPQEEQHEEYETFDEYSREFM